MYKCFTVPHRVGIRFNRLEIFLILRLNCKEPVDYEKSVFVADMHRVPLEFISKNSFALS